MRPVTYPYPVHKLQLPAGGEMAYIDTGKGDTTLLFIHGLALYSLSWKKNIEYLEQHYRCIAVDLPGNGLSSKGSYPYGMSFFAEAVYELIQSLELKNVCVVGHSMGGQVALTLLSKHPHCADRLVLCAPAGFETFNGFQRSVYKNTIYFLDFFSSEENSLRKIIRMSFFNYPEQVHAMADELVELLHSQSVQEYRRMIEACIDSMLDEPVYDKLPFIRQKTLVLFGDRDALIPNRLIHPVTTRHIAEEGVRLLPDAELVVLPKCGHFLQIEKADEVNILVHRFLSS